MSAPSTAGQGLAVVMPQASATCEPCVFEPTSLAVRWYCPGFRKICATIEGAALPTAIESPCVAKVPSVIDGTGGGDTGGCVPVGGGVNLGWVALGAAKSAMP